MQTWRFSVAAALLCAAGTAAAQDVVCSSSVVGFSADGKMALVRYEVSSGLPAPTIELARLELASGKLIKRHPVVTEAEIEAWSSANPDGTPEAAAKAMARIRGDRWKALEKELASDGFKVEPSYKALPKQGNMTDASFTMPDGAVLRQACKDSDENGDHQTCDLVAAKGAKQAVLKAAILKNVWKGMMAGTWIEKAYLDQKGSRLLAIDSRAGSSADKSGVQVIELAGMEKALK